MKWRLLLVGALVAAACSAPEPPDAWSVERITDGDEVIVNTLCVDVTELALGSHANDPRLASTLGELARVAALAGAVEALPTINEITAVGSDDSLTDQERFVALHDLLVAASIELDDATAAACEVPVFSALYATSGFAECHFEMEIPVAAYTLEGVDGACSSIGRPTHLPCWSTDGRHLPLDCVTKEIVQAVDDEWREAGEPRLIEIDRPVVETVGPVVHRPTDAPECVDLGDLFMVPPIPNGPLPDYDRLIASVASLDAETQSLVEAFVAAAADPPSLDEFEDLVASLDAATVDACGIPLVSAWTTMTSTVFAMPCWVATDHAYPAYAITDCPDAS